MRARPSTSDVAPTEVDLVDLARVVGGFVHRDDRRDLDRLERAVVQVALQPGERRDHLRVSEHEADAPAGHREALRQAVDLDRDILRARHLQERRRLVPVEAELRVREVVHEEDVVLARELDHARHELEVDALARRVVRERHHHDARSRPCLLPGGAQVGEEVLIRTRCARSAHPRPRGSGPRCGSGTTGSAPSAVSPGPSSTHMRCEKPSFAPMVTQASVSGSRSTPKRPLVQVRDGKPEAGYAAGRGVPVVARVLCRLRELLDRDRGRRDVRVAEPEVDDVHIRTTGCHLQRVDLGKGVRRKRVDATEFHASRVAPPGPESGPVCQLQDAGAQVSWAFAGCQTRT